MNRESVLCYVEDNFAYFTTSALDYQTGFGWDTPIIDGGPLPPDEFCEADKQNDIAPWKILQVGFSGAYSPYSAISKSPKEINRSRSFWLMSHDDELICRAGIPLGAFCKTIARVGGEVFLPAEYQTQTLTAQVAAAKNILENADIKLLSVACKLPERLVEGELKKLFNQ